MIIVAKSGVSTEQLHDKYRKGAEYIELHLNVCDIDTEEKIEQIIKNIKDSKLVVKAVHTPIDRKYLLEGLLKEEGYEAIENTFILAEEISKINNEGIHIVFHHDLHIGQLKDWGMYDRIKEKLEYLLFLYPNTLIDLENETVIELGRKRFEFKSNYYKANLELCEELRKDLGTDRIGLVLDICHAESSIRILQDFIDKGLYEKVELKNYFEQYKQYLNIIHLSNTREFGYDNNHGAGFDTKEEIEYLREIMMYVKEMNFKGMLTLEVQEVDYLNCIVYEKLYKQVKEIMKKM